MKQIGQHFYRRRRQKALAQSLQQSEQRFTIAEPILDEFNVTTDDRVSSLEISKDRHLVDAFLFFLPLIQ